jgi:hypothetical protein
MMDSKPREMHRMRRRASAAKIRASQTHAFTEDRTWVNSPKSNYESPVAPVEFDSSLATVQRRWIRDNSAANDGRERVILRHSPVWPLPMTAQ